MVKTSFRIQESAFQKLAELADKCHNGNKTAALFEAIERYHAAKFIQSVILGWVSVRTSGKNRCSSCNNPIEGQAFTRLTSGGVEGKLYCSKCAK